MLTRLFARKPSQDPARFGEFLAARAAFVAQKTVLDYCRVKAGRDEARIFADADFLVALKHCRWRVYLGALSDVAALAEAWLRPQCAGREAVLIDALVAWHAATLAATPPPEEEAEAAAGAAIALPGRLAGLQLAAPRPANLLPLDSEPPLFATLPVHPDQRPGEAVAIRGALRFHIVSTQQEMERGFDRDALARAMVTHAAP